MKFRDTLAIIFVGVFVLFFVSAIAFNIWAAKQVEEGVVLFVTDKQEELNISSSTDSNNKIVTRSNYTYYVYTTEDAYIVEDSILNWHFTSKTVWAKIPDGPATCVVVLAGVRIGFLSMFKNIIEVESCKSNE